MMEKPEAFVQRSGVVRLRQGTYAEIMVNGIDLIAEVYEQVFDKIKPATDFDRNFAGKVTIMVSISGDLEEE